MNGRKPVRVLVVEDDEVNRLLTVRLLEAQGCLVDTAVNGQKALALLGNEAFDFVLMDISMPKIDGLALARQMKKQSRTRNLPVIAMTAFTCPGDRERFLAEGMDGYIAKPVTPEELSRVIRPASRYSDFVDIDGLTARTGGDIQFMQEVTMLFCEASAGVIAEMKQSSDLEVVAERAHKLKGAASTAGAKMVAELADFIRSAAAAGDVAGMRSACEELPQALDVFKESLVDLGILPSGEGR